jgi:O-antigen/teichoic acid export membrane protein
MPDRRSVARNVIRSSAANYLGKFTWLVCGFFLTPFMLRHLGTTDYGIWALAGSVIAYGSVLDFGLSGAVIKYVAEYHVQRRTEQLRSVVATALCVYSIMGLVAVLFSFIMAPLFPVLFQIPVERRASAVRLLLALGLGLGVSIPCTITTSVLRGLQRYDLVGVLSFIANLLYAAGVVALLLSGGGVLSIGVWGAVVTVVMQAPGIYLIRHVAPELRIGLRDVRRSMARSLASFSSWLFIEDVVSRLQMKTIEVVIGASMPVRFVTPFSIARRLSELCQILTDQFMKVLIPLASEFNALGHFDRLQALYIAGTRLTLAIFLPVACAMAVLMKPLLTAWVGSAYAAYAPIAIILLVASLINTSQWPAGAVLQGMGRYQAMVMMSSVSAVSSVVLSIVLIRPLGLSGVAIATLIPTTVVCIGLVLPYAMRTMQVSAARLLREVMFPVIIPCVPGLLILLIAARQFRPVSLISIGALGAAGCATYAITYFLVGASRLERELARDLFARARHSEVVRRAAATLQLK